MTEELKPPILLIGNVRSGTSMMARLFDAHPEVVGWPEPRTVWTYADPARRHDRFDADDATPRVKRWIRGRFLAYQRRHGGLRVMEKTPSNVLRVPYVHAVFPESKLLYLIREPLAYLSSSDLKWNRRKFRPRRILQRLRETPLSQLHHSLARHLHELWQTKVLRTPKTPWGPRYPGIHADLERLSLEEVIAKQWVACSRTADEDLDRLPDERVLRLRYEDFVADPVPHFRRVLDHFDLEMTAEIERLLRETIDPGRQHKWRRLPPDALARCLPIYRDEMARHGYSIPEELQGLSPVL